MIEGCTAFIAENPQRTPVLAKAHVWRGRAYVNLGAPDRAIEDLNQAADIDSHNKDVLFYRGVAHELAGLPDHAIADYHAALGLDRENIFPWLALFELHRRAGRVAPAMDALGETIRIQPRNGTWYSVRGFEHWRHGELVRALDDFEKASALSDVLADVLYGPRCILFSMTGHTAAALALCDDAIAKSPDEADGYLARAIARLHMKHLSEAVADFDRVMTNSSSSAQTKASSLFGRGVAKRMLGDAAGSDADIAAAVTADPEVTDRMKQSGVSP